MDEVDELLEHRAGHDEVPPEAEAEPLAGPGLTIEPEPAPPGPRYHLTDEDYRRAARSLKVDVATIRAVAEVEAAGSGFLPEPDRRPKCLFESHVFGRLTGHKHRDRDPRGRAISSQKWDKSLYGAAGAWQYTRLNIAAALNYDAAYRSASFGTFQILGLNHRAVGYDTPREFFAAMESGVASHIDMLVAFIKHRNIATALQQKNWARFASVYNGPGYRNNRYDTRLAAAWRRHAGRP